MPTATTPMEQFVALSALLTGIDAAVLAPALDPNDIKQTFFDTAQAADPANFAALLQLFANNQQHSPAEIAAAILNPATPGVCFLARAIMLAWYLGSWYEPAILQKLAGSNPPPGSMPGRVISSGAYTQGRAWDVAQAHPMGYSNFTFGYWNTQPPTLADFIQGDAA